MTPENFQLFKTKDIHFFVALGHKSMQPVTILYILSRAPTKTARMKCALHAHFMCTSCALPVHFMRAALMGSLLSAHAMATKRGVAHFPTCLQNSLL